MFKLVRLLIYLALMLFSIALKRGMFSVKSAGRIQHAANVAGFTPGDARLNEPAVEPKPVLETSPVSEQSHETQADTIFVAKPADHYQSIVERNMFALQPPPPPSATTVSTPPPTEDLSLTGLCSLYPARYALFTVTEPGKPPISFNLAEGEQNYWLKVLSVNVENGTVKVLLKKPVMRIRNIGVEVLISL